MSPFMYSCLYKRYINFDRDVFLHLHLYTYSTSNDFFFSNEFSSTGLYLSDIPIHDATRDLILISEHRNAECALTQRLQILTDKLQITGRELKKEQQLADKLLYSILPPSVANELRLKRPVKAKRFEVVTVLFSGIVNFSDYCSDITEPMEILSLLNNIYLTFDGLMDMFDDVYKVGWREIILYRNIQEIFYSKLVAKLC